jgi:hypothetical protein
LPLSGELETAVGMEGVATLGVELDVVEGGVK